MLNVGTPDRIIRAVVGILIVAAPFLTGWSLWLNPVAWWISVIVGAVLIVTAVIGFCPIYAALGLSSKRKLRN